jgi:hypothetical protein
MIDVGSNRLGKPVPFSNLMFTPIVDLAETFHLRRILLPNISWINGYDHIIQDVLAPQPAYLLVDDFGEIPIIQIPR